MKLQRRIERDAEAQRKRELRKLKRQLKQFEANFFKIYSAPLRAERFEQFLLDQEAIDARKIIIKKRSRRLSRRMPRHNESVGLHEEI